MTNLILEGLSAVQFTGSHANILLCGMWFHSAAAWDSAFWMTCLHCYWCAGSFSPLTKVLSLAGVCLPQDRDKHLLPTSQLLPDGHSITITKSPVQNALHLPKKGCFFPDLTFPAVFFFAPTVMVELPELLQSPSPYRRPWILSAFACNRLGHPGASQV